MVTNYLAGADRRTYANTTTALFRIKTTDDLMSYLHVKGSLCVGPNPQPLAEAWVRQLGTGAGIRCWNGHVYIVHPGIPWCYAPRVYGETVVAEACALLMSPVQQDAIRYSIQKAQAEFIHKYGVALSVYDNIVREAWDALESIVRTSMGGRAFFPWSEKLPPRVRLALSNLGYNSPAALYRVIDTCGGVMLAEFDRRGAMAVSRYMAGFGFSVTLITNNKGVLVLV